MKTNIIFVSFSYRKNERDDRRSRAVAVLGGVANRQGNLLYSGRKSSGMQSAAEIRESIAQQWFTNQEMHSYSSPYARSRFSNNYLDYDMLDDDDDSLPPKPLKRGKKSHKNKHKVTTVNIEDVDNVSKLTGVGADEVMEITTGEEVD